MFFRCVNEIYFIKYTSNNLIVHVGTWKWSKPMSARLPTFFLTHGGGPWPYMTGAFRQQFTRLEASLKGLRQQLPAEPQAILIVSGHWEDDDFAVMDNPSPPMVYDYSG